MPSGVRKAAPCPGAVASAGGLSAPSSLTSTSITTGRDGVEITARNQAILPDNPHVKFHNGQRGYVRCAITPERWTTDFRVVPFVSKPGASIETRASMVVEDGKPGVQRA